MDLELVVTPGLGDNSYVLASGDEAVIVDPQRDAGRFLALAESKGLTVRHVLETHVHNDYVSGAVEIRAATGAEIVAPAGGGYAFQHRGVAEGAEVTVGDIRLVAMETPGHTPEHLSYLVYERSDAPVAVFTGGSLMVGGAGRTDLLGEDVAEELTRAQYRTLRRLASLPDSVQVLATHGAGSFCGSGPAPPERVSTMMEERRRNRALALPDEESFVRRQLTGLLAYPTYYRHMAAINRRGPRLLANMPRPRPLSAEEVEARMASGARLVDGRDRAAFASAHIPGSINVELSGSFASYVGWMVPFDWSVALVIPEPEAVWLEEAVTALLRVGYERLEGYLEGGVESWRASGRPVRSYPVATVEDLCEAYHSGAEPSVLDVRQQREWDRGHIPGSIHRFVADLPGRLDDLPRDRELWVACSTGNRSSIAASLLDGAGFTVRSVVKGGVADWLKLCPPDQPADGRP
jgi:glyoxylase-like metal-dependent hydrolase (beta-lactamase superfamily II)